MRSTPEGELTRYEGVVRTADLPDPRPITYEDGETWTQPEIPFTAWVDADGFVVRLELTLDGVDSQLVPWDTSATVDGIPARATGTARIGVELRALGEPVTIELPPADQVQSLDELYPLPTLENLIPPEEREQFCADLAGSDDRGPSDTMPEGFPDFDAELSELCEGLAPGG